METETNIAELLKNCPQGMELYSPIFGEVYLDKIIPHLAIRVTTDKKQGDFKEEFLYDGRYRMNGECMLFPSKDQRDWSKFQRPFKDGDILTTNLGSVFFLNTRLNSDENYGCYVGIGGDGSFHICAPFAYKECCSLATEEEREKLFKAIKDNGYKWNAETKTLDKLIEPRFKVGNKVKRKDVNYTHIVTIAEIEGEYYGCVNEDGQYSNIFIESQDNWELAPNKFDITTLKPFEGRVLVRDFNDDEWCPAIWGVYGYGKEYPHIVVSGNNFIQCIPYEKNEHLLGTTNDCDDYYKTWK